MRGGPRPVSRVGGRARSRRRHEALLECRAECCLFSPPTWQRRLAPAVLKASRRGLRRMAASTTVGRCTCLTGAGRSPSSGTARCRSRSAPATRGSVLPCVRYAPGHRRDAREEMGVGRWPAGRRHKLVRRPLLVSLPGAGVTDGPRLGVPTRPASAAEDGAGVVGCPRPSLGLSWPLVRGPRS